MVDEPRGDMISSGANQMYTEAIHRNINMADEAGFYGVRQLKV
jgi:hypothetical protein